MMPRNSRSVEIPISSSQSRSTGAPTLPFEEVADAATPDKIAANLPQSTALQVLAEASAANLPILEGHEIEADEMVCANVSDATLIDGPRDIYEAFALFLQVDVASGDATEDTFKAYHREVKFWVEWCQSKGIAPEKATRRHVEAYREALKARGLNVSTRSHKLSIVRRFYEAGVKHGLLDVNPAQRVRGGKDLTPPEEKIHAFTHDALVDLLGHVPQNTLSGIRDRAIVGLMAIHGLRRVEVFRLNHSDVQIEGETASLVVTGKGNKMRRVWLRPDTFDVIRAYTKGKGEVGLPTSGALFLAHGNRARGQRLSRRGINLLVDLYLNETSLKRSGVSCGALRHTFGTLAVEGGAPVNALREAMGHQNIETTGMYVKAVERKKNNPSNFIDVEV